MARGSVIAKKVRAIVKINRPKQVEVSISRSRHPESAAHADDAVSRGQTPSGVVDRSGAAARRRENLRGVPTQKGKDRDEFPPAVLDTGSPTRSVQPIGSSDNRGSGSSIGHQLRDVPDGTPVVIRVVD